MTRLQTPPGFFVALFTLGIARALWISRTNRELRQGGAGALFAFFLLPFANYGVAKRLNVALAQAGSLQAVSAMACFWLTGFPFIGAARRLRRGVVAFNDAHNVRAQVAQPA